MCENDKFWIIRSFRTNPDIRRLDGEVYWQWRGYTWFPDCAKRFESYELAEKFVNRRLANGWAERHNLTDQITISDYFYK